MAKYLDDLAMNTNRITGLGDATAALHAMNRQTSDSRYAAIAGPFAPSSTGATTATRYVGGTASGAPVSGTFVTGDHVVSADGHIYICTSGGTPGTWVDSAASSSAPTIGQMMALGL